MRPLRSGLEAFFRRRTSAAPEAAWLRPGCLLHQALARSITEIPAAPVARRRPSMCHDGTPVVYSLKLHRGSVGAAPPGFRMLVEPGGVGIPVSRQIAFSLRVVQELIDQLAWQAAAGDLNEITELIFPAEAEIVDAWWGGVWLGASVGPPAPELRLYLNLRHGDAPARWQRLADVLGHFGGPSLTRVFGDWIAAVHPHGIPVGLGIVIAGGRLAALRAYAGLHQPSLDSLSAVLGPRRDAAGPALDDLCRGFAALGGFRPQSVTVGFDFIRDRSGVLRPEIARTKVDASCQLVEPSGRAALAPWIRELLSGWGLDPRPLDLFEEDLRTCWGACETEFLSVGFRDGVDHATVYSRPVLHAPD
ncbi:MAG TPA: hypothetical protein VF756_04310 [Thermoanaerobaculia bacterium]